jgi:hypothetical protein
MPINEVAVTAVIATPELISPGDATEAGADGLELVEGPVQLGFAVGPGKLRPECGVGKGAAISALETETNTVKAGIRTRASTNLFIKISSNSTDVCWTALYRQKFIALCPVLDVSGIFGHHPDRFPSKTMIAALAIAPPVPPVRRSLSLVFYLQWKPVDC